MKKIVRIEFLTNKIFCGTIKKYTQYLEGKMFSIAIVDDEKTAADAIQAILARYAAERNIVFHTDWYSNPVQFLTQYTNRYDLVLLDIDMPGLNGMDAARKLRDMDDMVSLMFITNMRQYAISGYEVNADDFVVKPVSYYDLAMKLDRVRKKDMRKEQDVVSVKDDGVVKFIPVRDIRYVEVLKHRLLYHTPDKVYEERGTLKKLEPVLVSNHFSKCNNYCLVNLRFVSGIDGFTLFISYGRNSDAHDEVQISHPRKKEFIAALNKYLGLNL